ncbi:MAG: hypothetical protein PHY54_18210 [Methylococcales bacterium]|nr:hypothetical protein [Methylococcales bacterium]
MKTQYCYIEDLFLLLTGSDYRLDWPVLSFGKQKRTYQCFFARNQNLLSPPNRHECWTNFVQLRDNFGQIFSTWRNKHEELGPGFYLYLGTRRGITQYVENRFVNLIWGIESLHRRKPPKQPMPTKLEEKIQRILSNIEAEKDRRWLKKKIEHTVEPTLENRIFETFRNVPFDLDDKLLRQFSKDCADNRNQISHFGGPRHKENYGEFVTNLSNKCEALSYLYHALILKEIGVDVQILNSRMLEGYGSHIIKTALSDVGLLPKP